nr:putative golgin subfamily A member 8F/8G [Macaca nemestrina]
MVLPGEGDGGGHLDSEEEEAPQRMQNIPEDRESWEVRWHFSTSLEPMPRKSKWYAGSPWFTQWLHPRGPQGLGSDFMEDKVDLKEPVE